MNKMPSYTRLNMFVEVVKQQSFAKAAKVLGLSAPALSKQVQRLEDDLGVRLLHRTTRQVLLSEEGALYYDKVRKALEDLQEAEQQLHERKECPTGQLKINIPLSFGLKYLIEPLAAFAAQYPQVKLDVQFDDRHVDVVGEGYDLVVRIAALNDSSLIARKLASCPLYIVASKGYLALHGAPQVPQDLIKHRCILYTRHGSGTEWRYADKEGVHGMVHLNPVMSANNGDMMLEAVQQGLGIAVLPVFLTAEGFQNGTLVHVLPDYKMVPERGIYAVFPQNRHLSTKVRLLVDALSTYCKTLPW